MWICPKCQTENSDAAKVCQESECRYSQYLGSTISGMDDASHASESEISNFIKAESS